MEIGAPVVTPSYTPERISARSRSLRGVVTLLWPTRRRSSSCWISSTVSGRPPGTPSITTPSAGPWDSPQVVSLKIFPKLLPIVAGSLRSHLHLPPSRLEEDAEDVIVQLGRLAESQIGRA